MEGKNERDALEFVHVHAGAVRGVEGVPLTIEVHRSAGVLGVTAGASALEIIGLRESASRESRVRVRSALAQVGFVWPHGLTVNLAPVETARAGVRSSPLDLAIAVGVARWGATGEARERLESARFLGELSLAGELRPVRGLIPMLMQGRRTHTNDLSPVVIVPQCQLAEAALSVGTVVLGARTLGDVLAWVDTGETDTLVRLGERRVQIKADDTTADLGDVAGLEAAKRALEVAAAGGHNVLLIGPPGAGKTMVARRLPGLLPPMNLDEALEVATIASAAGLLGHRTEGGPLCRPFRAPHHTASVVALVGGGDPVSPGEVTLAHGGVLFLDELPEFSRAAIEAIAKTARAGLAVIYRRDERVSMPARPMLVGAINSCPCGGRGTSRECTCSDERIAAYFERLRPVMNIFDVQIELELPLRPVERMPSSCGGPPERSSAVRERVTAARARPRPDGLETLGRIDRAGIDRLVAACEERKLQAAPVMRLTHTIAALAGRELALLEDVDEALDYRLGGAGEPLAPASSRADAPPSVA